VLPLSKSARQPRFEFNEKKHRVEDTLSATYAAVEEGIPVVSDMQKMHIDADVPKTFASDYGAELDEVKEYNAGILVCCDAKDLLHGRF
jgi:bacterioferritin (cytochrome b1)